MSEQLVPEERPSPVLQGAELCPAGKHTKCGKVLNVCAWMEESLLGSLNLRTLWISRKGDESPPGGFCFLGPKMSVRNLGDLRIWSMGWEPAEGQLLVQIVMRST